MDEEKAPLLSSPNACPCACLAHSVPPQDVFAHERAERRRLRKKRFIKFFFAGVILFFVLRILFHDVLRFRRHHRHGHERHRPSAEWSAETASGFEPWPIPPNLIVKRCAEWPEPDELVNSARLDHSDDPREIEHLTDSFELPISAERLFLLSRGPLSVGKVEVVQSEEAGDSVVVSVTTSYNPPHLLEFVQVCQLEGVEGGEGVGIFSIHDDHHHHDHHTHTDFRITVALPKGSDNSPLLVKNFDTSMGIFSHHIGDLADSVYFDSISLKGSMLPITVESLSGDNVKAFTANAPIDGNFTAKDSLKLSTSNAHIDVNVNLYNNKSSPSATSLDMRTANAPITGTVSLFATTKDSSPSDSEGTFEISSRTSMGHITIDIPTAPLNSTVDLTANTALAPVDVSMHPTYEGTFSLSASPFSRHQVLYDEDVEDPSGEGRKRVVVFTRKGRGVTKGSVYWDGEGVGEKRGSVALRTTMSDVTLNL